MENINRRIKGKTPKWFRQIIRVCLTLSGVGFTLLAAEEQVPGFVLPELMHTISQWFVVAGLVGAAIAKTAKEGE